MSGISWIEYKGKKILYVDYHPGQLDERSFKLLEEQSIYEKEYPDILIISDFKDTTATHEYMVKVKEYGKNIRNQNSKVKNAAIGITGVKKTLFNSYIFFTGDTHTKSFNSIEEAKEWLVSEE